MKCQDSIPVIHFKNGKHDTPDDGLCVMEAAAQINGEAHTDCPACSDIVITRFAQHLNDICDDEFRVSRLQELPWRVIGTNVGPEMTRRRMFRAVDFAVREIAPFALRCAGLFEHADRLANLPLIVDADSASHAADAAASHAASHAADASASHAASHAADASASHAASHAADAAADAAADSADDSADAATHAASHAADAAEAPQQIWEMMLRLLVELIEMSEPKETTRFDDCQKTEGTKCDSSLPSCC